MPSLANKTTVVVTALVFVCMLAHQTAFAQVPTPAHVIVVIEENHGYSQIIGRPADFFVYLFNIAKQEYKISRLPLIKDMIIPARKENEKYALVTKLPSPFKFPKGNIDSNEIDR